MSASERLRELDWAMDAAPWDSAWLLPPGPQTETLAKLRNALPLIADVVEAAERAVSASVVANDDLVPTCRNKLAPALTALRDALERE